ncbi:hypothetical protein ID866_7734 [Astraeus odoratus]|nr:hypothetical protein ID866_7734 [Astraeus odoratus]
MQAWPPTSEKSKVAFSSTPQPPQPGKRRFFARGIEVVKRVVHSPDSQFSDTYDVLVDEEQGDLETIFANDLMIKLDTFDPSYLQPLKIFNQIVGTIANVILAQVEMDKSIKGLLDKIRDVYQCFMDKEFQKFSSTKETLAHLAQVVQECVQFINHYSETKSFWRRLGKNVVSKTSTTIASYSSALDSLVQQLRDTTIRDIHVTVHRVLEHATLQDIAYAAGVGMNTTKRCLDGTRTSILEEIVDWIDSHDPDTPRIFWLHGHAGKGKSAIAHTISMHYEHLGRLGSCFCFANARQTEQLHEKLFTTIARDLADRDVGFKSELAEAVSNKEWLKRTPDVMQQWQRLIVEPLSKLKGPMLGNIVVVIDALDASGAERNRGHILRLLGSSEVTRLPNNIRIFLTSRPLPDIHDALAHAKHVRSRSLDDISASIAERDMHAYISSMLKNLRDIFREPEITQLARKSDGLFEWARLACEFITTSRAGVDPRKRFHAIMSHALGQGNTLLDKVYSEILTGAIDSTPEALEQFHSVMRQILCTLEPLPISSLNILRSRFPMEVAPEDVQTILRFMASLFSGATDGCTPVRSLHTSFHDFLIDRERSREFFVDIGTMHTELAIASLRTMQDQLHFNICGLESSYVFNKDVVDLKQRIQEKIPPHLSYACRFWATHLAEATFDQILAAEVMKFLASEQLLFWLEALSLLKALGSVSGAMATTAEWLEVGWTNLFHGIFSEFIF